MQRAVEHRVLRASLGLRTIHRDIGVAHHVLGRVVLRPAHRDADADAGRELGRSNVHRLGDHGLQPRGENDGILLAHVSGQDRELVAAKTRDHVRRAKLRGDTLAEDYEELVTGAVPQAVVDRLEAVAVQEKHREAEARILARGLDRALQLLEEVGAVRKIGEVVVVRDVLQAALGDAARGHVLHLQNEARCVFVGDREERRRVQSYGDEVAVGSSAADLHCAGHASYRQ